MTRIEVPDGHPLGNLANTIAGLTGMEADDAVLGLALIGAHCLGCDYDGVISLSDRAHAHMANIEANLVLILLRATRGTPITFD